MTRDLRQLADTKFDVLVVGAGFYGVTIAWDAAQRGLAVAIIDKDDFGAATSFNNLKTLHGGLRSLSALDFTQMRLFIRERRALARIVPHLVRPLPFVVATTRNPMRSSLAWRMLLAANDAISRDRNDGLADPGTHLPSSRIVSREEALRLNPVVSPRGVTGGAIWYDYQMVSTDRVTFSFLHSAVDAGASAANYVRANRFLRIDGRVAGVKAEDTLTGETFDIRAKSVVNAAGPWAASLLADLPAAAQGAPPPRLSRAMNIVTRKMIDAHACGGVAGGRYLFMVPWRDVSMLGTSHDAHEGPADELKVSRWDLEAFLKDAREAFPNAGLTAGDIRLVHRGLLPMISGHDSHVKLLRESQVVDHSRHGLPGLVSVFGVRYTTARHTACRGRRRGVPHARACDPSALPHRRNPASGWQHGARRQLPQGGGLARRRRDRRRHPAAHCHHLRHGVRPRAADGAGRARSGAATRPLVRGFRRRNPLCGTSRDGPQARRCGDSPH